MKNDVFFKQLKKKAQDRKGASLAEMLFCILIVLMVSAAMATTVTVARNQFKELMRRSEANILASTLRSLITYELQYDYSVKPGTEVSSFVGQRFKQEMISTDQGGEYGYIVLLDESGSGSSDEEMLIGSGSYPNGLTAKVSSISCKSNADGTQEWFDVVLSIAIDKKEYTNVPFSVMKLNRASAASGT